MTSRVSWPTLTRADALMAHTRKRPREVSGPPKRCVVVQLNLQLDSIVGITALIRSRTPPGVGYKESR